ncbi:MAG: protein kinase domain-containing protein, partial [Ardenticatenaceae bacterium]
MNEQAGTLIGRRYRLLHPLGEGGVAEVWLARDERLDRLVALKLLRPQYAKDTTLLERFRREARIIAHLDSPHIVRIYDVEVNDGERFIAMEYVEGQDLSQLIAFEAPLPPDQALRILRHVAAGVAVAHEAGLIHRDLK